MEKETQPKATIWFFTLAVIVAFIFALLHFDSEVLNSEPMQNGTALVNRKSRVYSVFYKAGVFSPTNIRIKAGDTVKFQNSSLATIRIISDLNGRGDLVLPGLDSVGKIAPGESFDYTFSQSGIFGYYNFDNDYERGAVIVRE